MLLRAHKSPRHRGSIVVLSAFLLMIFMIFAAFGIDVGFLMLQRTRAQVAVDAAVLAGVDVMGNGRAAVEAEVDAFLRANGFDPAASEAIERKVELGVWDDKARTFQAAKDEKAEAKANAIRVNIVHSSVDSFFGGFLGAEQYTVRAGATAVRFRKARDIVLVIDCSTSMSGSMSNDKKRIENARTAARALVDELGKKDRVGLAVYSWTDPDRNNLERTGIVEKLLDFDKKPTKSRISDLDDGEYGSGTNIGGGLRAGLDVFLGSADRPPEDANEEIEQILVLLTDGRVNRAEPYPFPNDSAIGMLPPPPYLDIYDEREAVTQWANSIKAREIKIHVVTLGDGAYDQLMVDAASPDGSGATYYHHVGDGGDDYQVLLEIYRNIGAGDKRPKLVQ